MYVVRTSWDQLSISWWVSLVFAWKLHILGSQINPFHTRKKIHNLMSQTFLFNRSVTSFAVDWLSYQMPWWDFPWANRPQVPTPHLSWTVQCSFLQTQNSFPDLSKALTVNFGHFLLCRISFPSWIVLLWMSRNPNAWKKWSTFDADFASLYPSFRTWTGSVYWSHETLPWTEQFFWCIRQVFYAGRPVVQSLHWYLV